MIRNLIFIGLLFFIVSTGCESSPETAGAPKASKEKTSFPSFIVGKWRSENGDWEVTFDENGNIASFRNYWKVTIQTADGGAYEDLSEGSYAIYDLGPCTADYEPNSRELNVKIIIDYFRLEIPGQTFEGTCEDELLGVVSADEKQWRVSWFQYGELVDAEPEDRTKVEPQALVFAKVQPEADLSRLKTP